MIQTKKDFHSPVAAIMYSPYDLFTETVIDRHRDFLKHQDVEVVHRNLSCSQRKKKGDPKKKETSYGNF